VTIYFLFLGAGLASANPKTFLNDSVTSLWVEDDIKKYPNLAKEYLIHQTLDNEFYIYPQKNMGYLRSFLPFKNYNLNGDLYFCVSESTDDVISSLGGAEMSARNDLHMITKNYLIVLANSVENCNKLYAEEKYLRLFGDFNPAVLGRILETLDAVAVNSKCNINMKLNFLRDVNAKLDIEIKYKGGDINTYANVSIIKNHKARFLNLIADETKAMIASCEAPK
jgi:hypothetical protein